MGAPDVYPVKNFTPLLPVKYMLVAREENRHKQQKDTKY